MLFVAGEAGIGKTRLLGSIARRARAGGFAVFRAAAFPGDVQSLAGLMLDLASDLMSAPEPVLGQLGRSLASRIRVIPADAGDAHHRRRLLVQDLADLLVTVDPGAPVLIILEDLHWADELSLDVLGHLAGRIANRPILIAGAYRSDELYPSVPLRELRSRLLGQRLAEEIRLPRLGLDQTATMTSATLGRAVPAQLVTAIHERTDGIPLHVEEFLAAIDENTLTPQSGAAVQAAAVPDTLSDAVLSRARRLTAATRDVASAAAVIGRSFDFDLLTAVTDAGPDDVAGALRELQEAYFVLPGADAVTFDFRHALIRDTLYADTGLPLRRRLHERAAAPRSNAATVLRSSRPTLSRRGAPELPTSTRSPPRTRPVRCRLTARHSTCAAGRCAPCLPGFRRWIGPGCSPRSVTRLRRPTTTSPRRRRTGWPMS